ncbi:MAG: polysulfide reductase NrfD [Candidatus Rokubacteria bacterium]|nr:polysulfide reductase NrfD [Candidatus Rokubacteria bacterium]MBI3825438.1 polysulfide reductase NrfD [Candidatus Rokubacteria bacterium]
MLKTPGWEWMIVVYFFVGGIAGGAYFTAALADTFGTRRDGTVTRVGYLLALPLVALCGILLIADLGVPTRFMNMLRVFKFWNPMSIGAWGVGIFGLFSVVSAGLSFSERLATLRRGVGLVGMIFGFFLASYTGVLLSTTAQPFWGEARLMGALFLASGASTGMAAVSLVLLLIGGATGEGWRKIRWADRSSMVIELVVLGVFLAALGAAARPITTGHFAPLFWGGLVGAGLLVPLGLDIVAHRVKVVGALSAVLVLVGGFVLRYVVLMSIQS